MSHPPGAGDHRSSRASGRRRLKAAIGTALGVILLFAGPVARAGEPAALRIDVDRPLQRIDPQLFGSNVTWNSQDDFLKPGSTAFYPPFLYQVKSAGYSVERFPGGTLSSF